MFQPTEEQAQVLAQHGIRAEQVLDARGMARKLWQAECKRQSKAWAFTPDSPCQKGRHVLRDSSGHCVQCNPKGVSYSKRHHEDAWVYIAWSESECLHKIGSAKDIGERRRTLNEGYGDAKDWMFVYKRTFKNGGRVESAAKGSLDPFAVERSYNHRGKTVFTRELFDCDYGTARNAVEALAADAVGPADDAGRILTRWKSWFPS